MFLRPPLIWIAGLLLLAEVRGDNFNVTNINDAGPGSLRQAILDANAHPNSGILIPDTIRFSIPGAGVRTIVPLTQLPEISAPAVLDGYTQPGAKANTQTIGDDAILLIELNGNGAAFNGLTVSAGNSTVRGLVIGKFNGNGSGTGIWLNTNGGNKIEGCFIGSDPAGAAESNNQTAILIDSPGNTIGGTDPAARNLILRSVIVRNDADGNTIQGNYLGVTADGTTLLGTGSAISLQNSDNNFIGGDTATARNIIASGIGVNGDTVLGGGASNTIQGNYIGTNATGTAMVPPGGTSGTGISLFTARNNLILGNVIAGFGNVAGSFGSGITISSGTPLPGGSNTVKGNLIGTNATGTAALPNGTGISISSGMRPSDPVTSNNVIGGTTPGDGNVISGNNGWGVRIIGGSQNPIQGNFVGVAADGSTPLPNGLGGILNDFSFLPGKGNGNVIGGTTPGARNLIAFNGAANIAQANGVRIISGTGNAVLGNSIFGNYGLGIDLGNTYGQTLNDPGDTDGGGNNQQNFPVITSVSSSEGNSVIAGTLNSVPNTTYRIEFFANEDTRQSFLGSIDVTTDANGDASFSFNAPQIGNTQRVTATATDPGGNTSEFSPLIGQLLNISTRLRVQTGDNALIGGFIISGTDPKRIMVRGIGPSLASFGIIAFLENPTLELRDKNGASLGTNNDWKTRPDGSSQQAEIEATTIPPAHDLEAAIVKTLPASNAGYTAILRGHDGTTGIGVMEVYDLDPTVDSKLANISTRGLVETGNNVLIGGFISGGGVTKMIIRAIGPTLVNSGVSDPLQDPTLELVNASGTSLATNDNWKIKSDGSSQQAEIEATTIPPNDDRESAIVTSIPPGNYTAVVRGKNNTIGIAVVEVYNIQ